MLCHQVGDNFKYFIYVINVFCIGKGFKRLGDGTLNCSLEFFKSMLEIVETHHRQKMMSFSIDEKISDNESDDVIGFQ